MAKKCSVQKTTSQCLVIGALLSAALNLPAIAKEPVWQSSTSSSVQLGVRDKFGSLKGYKATFKVKGTKNTWTKEIAVKGDEFAYVTFPADFTPSVPDDHYSWQCLVKGKPVLSGKIDYKTDSTGGITLKTSD